ncbi:MAG: hypothetical protein JST54_30360 [Deltaproteobacteria bacterium]|nr:hypothetical protein [Deltaproteobacteria bacterium]
MKYFVKNEHGELTFGSIHELRAMFQQGMVEADDDVRPEDSQIWRKAGAIPELRELGASTRASNSQFAFIAVTLVCLSVSLYALVHLHNLLLAAICMVPVIGMSTRAFTKAMKRERG